MMLLLATLAVLPLLFAAALGQCNTDQNPYCKGNDKFEAICCPSPNVCYWADREGTPACCPAGQVCIDRDGFQVTPQAQYTTVEPAPVPAPEPTTIYTTISQKTTQQQQPTQQTTTITRQQPTQTQQGTVVITTTEGSPGPVEGIGSTVAATATEIVNVFEGAAPTAGPAQCAIPIAGALALAAWNMV